MFKDMFQRGMVFNADAAAGAAPVSGEAAPAPAAPAAPPSAYYPEGLSESFRGGTDKETIDRLAKHVAELPRAPEKPDGYALQIDDKLTAYVPKDDPALAAWRQVAHGLGLTEAQATGAINGLYSSLVQQGAVAPPMTDADFKKSLADLATIQGGSDQDRLRSGAERFHNVRDDLQALVTRKVIDDAGFQKLFGLMDRDVTALPVIEALISGQRAAGGPRGGGSSGSGDGQGSEQQMLARMYPTMVKA